MTDRLFDVPPPMTEREWQTTLQKGLTKEHWRWQHVYRLRTASGQWRTSTTAVGWPDLVCFRGPYVLALECKKSPKEKPDPAQLSWLQTFLDIPTGYAWVLNPMDDWQAIANWLRNPAKAPRIHGWEPHPFPIQQPATR